ncbi:hypothetical protein, partial [Rhizobium bangladeshense]|uniref:hypothetical protein n=1 Tax=Rhizobium bangladeshense TaxID=1138189 RepID=UPI001AEC94A7
WRRRIKRGLWRILDTRHFSQNLPSDIEPFDFLLLLSNLRTKGRDFFLNRRPLQPDKISIVRHFHHRLTIPVGNMSLNTETLARGFFHILLMRYDIPMMFSSCSSPVRTFPQLVGR